MKGRRFALLAGGLIVGAIGCNRNEVRPSGEPAAMTAAKGKTPPAAQAEPPPQMARDDGGKPPAPMKTSTLVAMADFKAQMALDPERNSGERSLFADQARSAYQQALKQDPNYTPALIGMAKFTELNGDRDTALGMYQAVLKKEPKNALAHFEKGMCLARGQQWPAAIDSLQTASTLDPQNTQYSRWVGFALARAGRSQDAVAWLSKTMPEADARINVAKMMQHISRDGEGRAQLEMAMRADPANEDARQMLADMNAPPADPAAAPRAVRAAAYDPDPAPAAALPSRPVKAPTVQHQAARPIAAQNEGGAAAPAVYVQDRPDPPLIPPIPISTLGYDQPTGPLPSLSKPPAKK